ncbi:MAG TPA: ROK family protein [Clostridia bacterium]|nr:ROK family protein [Clostridia bacterium]
MFNAGFDIGGSHIAGGLYDGDLRLVKRVDEPFPQGRPGDVPALVADMTGKLLEGIGRGALESVGLAVPGSIDRARERVINAYNLGFHDFPLRALVQERFPEAPVLLGNDADLAALAELHAGAFMGAQCAVLLTLGTGLGGGIIINGKLWRGGMGNGCEIGHAILDMSGVLCTCGVRGCAETRCAATALIREGREAAAAHSESMLNEKTGGDPARIDAKLVVDCARAGDPTALAVFDRYTDALSSEAASLINTLDPEVIALGGGVSGAGEFLFTPVRVKTRLKSFYREHARIVPAVLGNNAGMLGAALLYGDDRK